MTLPVVFTANGPSGYNLSKSLRFRSSASAYLNRTPATATNRKTYTWSGWIKLGKLTNTYGRSVLFSSTDNGGANNFFTLSLETNSSLAGGYAPLRILQYTSGAKVLDRQSTSLYRDPASWYHIVMTVDMTQSTATNRQRIYVNGVEVTVWTNTTTLAQNTDTWINYNQSHQIGVWTDDTGTALDGLMTELNFIDGQALTPSSFGETDVLTGVWKPKKYAGTYGTNGFYLPFTDLATTSGSNAGLGKDFSGNGNYFNTNNISVTTGSTYDSMTDVPTLTSATTANYCVLNPLNLPKGGTLSNGNLLWTAPSAEGQAVGTMYVSSGKFYWEMVLNTAGAGCAFGIASITTDINNVNLTAGSYVYYTNGNKYNGGSGSAYGATFTNGDIIGIALDLDAGTLVFYKNNTSQGTAFTSLSGTFTALIYDGTGASTPTFDANFGQRPFSYTPPTGFVALNTFNLPTSTIVKGNTVMDATLYTGTLLSNAVTNTAGFKPDLVWIKSRSAATNNKLTDSVRGVTKGLISNTTGAETTDIQGLTAFGTGGFTVGTDTVYNNLAATYVGWQWQAGQGTTSSNTSGSITSTVSVNASAGFSVVTWAGSGAAGTVGHGLGVTPAMIITKNRTTGSTDWVTWHQSLPSATALDAGYIYLESTAAASTTSVFYNGTQISSSVFGLRGNNSNVNASSNNYVAYCWAEIAGFSKFGSYIGNGSVDGPFIYTGFRPKFVLIKNSGATGGDWCIMDTSRSPYNVVTDNLFPNDSRAGGALGFYIDILSNGFKIRTTDTFSNASGQTVIYAAFAENPFKNALAR